MPVARTGHAYTLSFVFSSHLSLTHTAVGVTQTPVNVYISERLIRLPAAVEADPFDV